MPKKKLVKAPLPPLPPEDVAAARRLMAFVLELGYVWRRSSRRGAAVIGVLRRRLADPTDLERVLDWYIANYTRLRARLPTITSPDNFTRCWNWIVDVRGRDADGIK